MKKESILTQAGQLCHRCQTITTHTHFTPVGITLIQLNKGLLHIQSAQGDHDLIAPEAALLTMPNDFIFEPSHQVELSIWEWKMDNYHVLANNDCILIDFNELETETLKALKQSSMTQLPYLKEWLCTLSSTLFFSLLQRLEGSIKLSAFTEERLDHEAITSYLDSHYDEHITLEEVAVHFHRNPYALAHLYKKQTGMTIFDTLNRIRLYHALSHLRNSSCSIKEIALRSGFSSTSYFIQRFAKQYRLTPLQYRKQWRRKQAARAVSSHSNQSYHN